MIVYDRRGHLLHVNDKVRYQGTTWTIKKIKGTELYLEKYHQSATVDSDQVEKKI